jgi:NOL1/NOP2/sun family putative RNA methylase
MDLPVEFLERMQRLLGDAYEPFLATYGQPRHFGLRVNTMKISVDEFVRLAPFHLTPIPWTDNGFFYEREDDPARHPFYYAGLYYLQEPSAMTPASVLPVQPGDHVLDLCAAPGGKATALAARLRGKGLLVANDLSASRAKALLKNLEIFGTRNAFVTNAPPHKLAEQFEEAFDRILVDAPCSGEGMFRKDIANARAWSLERVATCARTQREITRQAVRMLRPGGTMLYSTCTFSAEENEGTIAWLLSTYPELELVDIPMYEGFSHGIPEALAQIDPAVFGEPEKLPELMQADKWDVLRKCVRIFPHCMDGEGHFLALLRKRGEWTPIHTRPVRSSKRPGKEEAKVLQEFLQDIPDIPMDQIELYNGQAYYMANPPQIRGGIPFLRSGLYLGELKKNRFEPSQSLAMALAGDGYPSTVNLDQSDPRVRRYLCGETVEASDLPVARSKGWQLVCVNGYPLGWGKLVNGTLKNKLHSGWRMQQ